MNADERAGRGERGAAVVAEHCGVTNAKRDGVAAAAADDDILAVAADDLITACIRRIDRHDVHEDAIVECGCGLVAHEHIVAVATSQLVVATATNEDVVAGAGDQDVIARSTTITELGQVA